MKTGQQHYAHIMIIKYTDHPVITISYIPQQCNLKSQIIAGMKGYFHSKQPYAYNFQESPKQTVSNYCCNKKHPHF